MKKIIALGLVAFFGKATLLFAGDSTGHERVMTLKVAAVQMRSVRDLSANVGHIEKQLWKCAAKGARVAVFPECALSGYFEDIITNISAAQLMQAEAHVAEVCRKANIYAILGAPHRDGTKLFNSAAVISPLGGVLERYHKIQLAERWPVPGDHLSVFRIDGVPCSIIICHDERYPELVRLPVLAGAKIIFYISHESGLDHPKKIEPYRAQIQARAVENSVYVVHANAPANLDQSGSHGQSRIIAPDGNVLGEASTYDEEVLTGSLDLRKATRDNSQRSLTNDLLSNWWKEGLRKVRQIE